MRRFLMAALVAVGGALFFSAVAAASQGSVSTITLGAHTSFDRTWNWQVSKSDDHVGSVTVQQGQSATIDYTVTVSPGTPAYTDSNWEVQDGMLITSPSTSPFTIDGLSDVSASASQDGGTVNTSGSISVCSQNANYIPPVAFPFTGHSVLCHYTIPLPDGTSGTVTGTVNFDDGSSQTGTLPFDFNSPGNLEAGQPVMHNGTVTVVDSQAGTLGTVSAPLSSPQVFTYSIPVPSTTCGTSQIPNTVSLLGDGNVVVGSATDTVTVNVNCTFASTLTPGFWKNHQSATTPLLPQNLGGYTVSTFAQATAVFGDMNFGGNNAFNGLAGHLLAAELNVANGAAQPTCATTAISQANAFLTAVGYTGPTGTYNPTKAQKDQAVALGNTLNNYNNGSSTC